MEATGNGENSDDRARTVVIQIQTEEELSTRPGQTTKSDNVLRSLSPLIISMRALGLYFTSKPHADPEAVSDLSRPCIRRCQTWNAGRIYATIMLGVNWVSAARCSLLFDSNETLDANLFLKLGIVMPNVLLNVIFRSTYYIASHTGRLDRVFRQADLCIADSAPKYSRIAKVATILSWTIVLSNTMYYMNMICIEGELDAVSLMYISKTYPIVENANVRKAVFIVLHVESLAAWALPQAMDTM